LSQSQDDSRQPWQGNTQKGREFESNAEPFVDQDLGVNFSSGATEVARKKYEEHLERARIAGTVIDTSSEIGSLRSALRADLAAFESLALAFRDEARQIQIQGRIDALWELLGSQRQRPIRPTYTQNVLSRPQPAPAKSSPRSTNRAARPNTP
jgi:hypothetical protein